jgi:hypothetical protein
VITHEYEEQIEGFWRKGKRFAGALKLAQRDVDAVRPELVDCFCVKDYRARARVPRKL